MIIELINYVSVRKFLIKSTINVTTNLSPGHVASLPSLLHALLALHLIRAPDLAPLILTTIIKTSIAL